MKADIPRPLRIPAWVPKEVARSARDGLDRRFWPLVRDSRMRNVWTVLSQRRNGSFMYPASATVAAATAEERQDKAMVALFNYAIAATLWPGTIITRGKAEEKRRRFLAKAEALQADAEIWLRDAPADTAFGLWSSDCGPDKHWLRLMAASQAYREMGAETYAADTRVVLDRARGDGDIRWFALAIASKCQELFGSPLYGTTATIASVALGRKVERRSVREWCDDLCG